MSKDIKYLYRYQRVIHRAGSAISLIFPDVDVLLYQYEIIRETPCYYFIKIFNGFPDIRQVAKRARVTFAYPTPEQAMINFKLRTRKEINILKTRLATAKCALASGEKLDPLKPKIKQTRLTRAGEVKCTECNTIFNESDVYFTCPLCNFEIPEKNNTNVKEK